jgi:hypothetical protein
MTFAYSHRPLLQLRQTKFVGEWKYLERALFELPEWRATRSAMELALLFRSLDDSEGISQFMARGISSDVFGNVYQSDGTSTGLPVREVSNKLIHASGIEWDFANPDEPLIVCHAHANQVTRFKWVRATIRINGLAFVCGGLMS